MAVVWTPLDLLPVVSTVLMRKVYLVPLTKLVIKVPVLSIVPLNWVSVLPIPYQISTWSKSGAVGLTQVKVDCSLSPLVAANEVTSPGAVISNVVAVVWAPLDLLPVVSTVLMRKVYSVWVSSPVIKVPVLFIVPLNWVSALFIPYQISTWSKSISAGLVQVKVDCLFSLVATNEITSSGAVVSM